MTDRIGLGRNGEEIVANYLCEQGYEILDRNWRIKEGELDLVAKSSNGIIVFVEVKTRSSHRFGDPLEAIDAKKALRLQRLALAWLALHQSWGHTFRIDCAGVILSQDSGELSLDYRVGVL